MTRAAKQPQENEKAQVAGNRPKGVTGRGTGERDVAGLGTRGRGEAENTEQQPRGIGKPVAMDW